MQLQPSDRELIERLGGPTKVAAALGYARAGGVQRVQNWMTRGIPATVKVQRPDLFMPGWVALPDPSTPPNPPPQHPPRDAAQVVAGLQRFKAA